MFFFNIYFILLYNTVLVLHTLTWIHHGCTCVPKHEPPSHLSPHNIPLGHPHAPAPSMLYPASDIDWRFDSYMIVYMFQCHSPKSSHLPIVFEFHSCSHQLQWFWSPPNKKSVAVSIVSLSICHEVIGLDAMILGFWMLSFKLTFSLSSFTFIKRLFSPSIALCHKGGVICISEVIYISPGNLDSSLCFIQPGLSHDVLCI